MATATQAGNTTDPNQLPSDAVNPQNKGTAPAPTTATQLPGATPTQGATDATTATMTPTSGIPATPTTPTTPAQPGTPVPTFTGANPTGMVGDAGPPVAPSVATPTVGEGAPPATPPAISTSLSPTSPASPALPTVSALNPNPLTATGTGTSSPSAVQLSATDPNNSLLNSTITAGQGTDPVALAESDLANYQQATDPAYQASLRSAEQQAAAMGGVGSGQLNSSLGDVANQRNLQLETQGNTFLSNALQQQMQNAWNQIGLAQQQQGFQAQQQGTAFNQADAQQQLQAQLQNQNFNQAVQQALVGSQGDPTQTLLQLSQIFSQQGGQAGQALSQLITGSNVSGQTAAQNQSLLNTLQQYLGLNGGASTSTGIPGVDPSTLGLTTPTDLTQGVNLGVGGP